MDFGVQKLLFFQRSVLVLASDLKRPPERAASSVMSSSIRSIVVLPTIRVALIWLLALGACCCDPGESDEEKKKQNDLIAQQEQAESEARRLAEERRLQEEKEAEEAAKDAALKQKVIEDTVLSCCEALAKQGFERRSMAYMKGHEICTAAHEEKKKLRDFVPDVIKALGQDALPVECTTK